MTKSEMFKEAHVRACGDKSYDQELPEIMWHSYAYYFRLQLRNLQAIERDSKAELVRGFQIIEPRRLWA